MIISKEGYHQKEIKASEFLESHGIPDPYYWRLNKEGKLVPQNSDTPIEDIIIVSNLVGQVEKDAVIKIQTKAPLMQEGDCFVWLSPIHPVYYPDTSKIIVSQRKGDLFLNRSMYLNLDALDCVLAAQEFALLGNIDPNIFKNTTDVRANPIFIPQIHEGLLGLALEKMLSKEVLNMIKNGEDFKAKENFMQQSMSGKKVVYGKMPLTCPVDMTKSAFNIFAGRDEYGSLEFECPNCHKTNTREPGKLLDKCQHCGKDVRCKP